MTEVVRSLRRVIRIVMVISEATDKGNKAKSLYLSSKNRQRFAIYKKKGLGVK